MNKTMIKVTGYSKDGNIEFTDILLPFKAVVCPICNGTGKHVNPAIDGHGLSAEDLDDEEFREAYLSGAYDITCQECSGNNVIQEVDEEICKLKISTYKGLIRYWNKLRIDSIYDYEY